MTELTDRAKEIISEIQYITVASVDENGMPWNAPVFTAYDEKFNFYWGTHKDSQKAKNIRANNNVFLVIYNSTLPAGKGEGVYIKATAEEITDPEEAKRAYKLIIDRHAPVSYYNWESTQGNGPIRLYKAVPIKAWVNDGDKIDSFYVDVRTEINL